MLPNFSWKSGIETKIKYTNILYDKPMENIFLKLKFCVNENIIVMVAEEGFEPPTSRI